MSSGNLMQRTFDVLRDAPMELSCSEIALRLGLNTAAVRGAIKRLRGIRLVNAFYGPDCVWRYRLRVGAERPDDGRGRRQT